MKYEKKLTFENCTIGGKPGKTFKIFMNEAKKHNLSDTDLLHVLLFMKIVYNKSYSIEDFPLLIKSDDIIINPLFI